MELPEMATPVPNAPIATPTWRLVFPLGVEGPKTIQCFLAIGDEIPFNQRTYTVKRIRHEDGVSFAYLGTVKSRTVSGRSTSLNLPEALITAAKQLAKARGISTAEVYRTAIELAIAEDLPDVAVGEKTRACPIYFADEFKAQLIARADQLGISMSDVARRGIAAYIEHNEEQHGR